MLATEFNREYTMDIQTISIQLPHTYPLHFCRCTLLSASKQRGGAAA